MEHCDATGSAHRDRQAIGNEDKQRQSGGIGEVAIHVLWRSPRIEKMGFNRSFSMESDIGSVNLAAHCDSRTVDPQSIRQSLPIAFDRIGIIIGQDAEVQRAERAFTYSPGPGRKCNRGARQLRFQPFEALVFAPLHRSA